MKAEYKRRVDKLEGVATPPEIPTVIWRFVEAKDGKPTGRYWDRYPDGTETEGDGYTRDYSPPVAEHPGAMVAEFPGYARGL